MKINNISNYLQFKKGIDIGKQLAEKLEKENPQKFEKIKKAVEKIMKGEKNVDI